jgi:hypothetical protein
MSHALTRKCAHYFVKLFHEGPKTMKKEDQETIVILIITLLASLFNILEPTPKKKKHFQQQAESAPSMHFVSGDKVKNQFVSINTQDLKKLCSGDKPGGYSPMKPNVSSSAAKAKKESYAFF